MQNRRSKMTYRMIKDALIELLSEKPLQKISVSELCEKADINRSTFYMHFEDINHLLKTIEEEIYAETPDIVSYFNLADENEMKQNLEKMLQYVYQNRETFRVLYRPESQTNSEQKWADRVLEEYERNYSAYDQYSSYYFGYAVNGVIGTLRRWILNDFALSQAELLTILMNMMYRPSKIYSRR